MHYKIIPFLIILAFTIPSVSLCLIPGNIIPSVISGYLFVVIIIYLFRFYKVKTLNRIKIVYPLAVWLFFNIIRGFLLIESRLDIVILLTYYMLFLFVIFTVIFSQSLLFLKRLFKFYIIIGLPTAVLLYFHPEFYSQNDFVHYLSPIYIFILLIPVLKKKYKIYVILIAILSFTYNFDIRANLLNITVAAVICLLYYVNASPKLYNKIRIVFLFLPFLFLSLGIVGVFNIFKIGDVIGESSDDASNMYVDSRTFIYSDVLLALHDDNAILWGLSGVGKYKTSIIDLAGTDYSEIYKDGRRFSEVGIMNIATWGGLIAVMFYFIIFYHASNVAISKSNNVFCKMLGLWVAFKWSFAFFEDPPSFNLYTLFLFLSIGLCLNPVFRSMSNRQIVFYFNNLFNRNIH